MSDFISGFWGPFIAIVTIAGLLGCTWLLFGWRLRRPDKQGKAPKDTGHVWDGNLREWNNPLPNWWVWLFAVTLVFAGIYLVLYPGLGESKGVLGWSQADELKQDRVRQAAAVKPLYDRYAGLDVKLVAKDAQAREIGQRLFLNNCAQCHGSDAGGRKGFPNLTDGDWLYGGNPNMIKTTIAKGRNGAMPGFGAMFDADKALAVAHYVRSLSGLKHDIARAASGKQAFQTICAACHGPNGTGNQALGAPNLTDKVWLYGAAEATIVETILKGRNNQMPAFETLLSPEQIHLLTAYVFGLSTADGK